MNLIYSCSRPIAFRCSALDVGKSSRCLLEAIRCEWTRCTIAVFPLRALFFSRNLYCRVAPDTCPVLSDVHVGSSSSYLSLRTFPAVNELRVSPRSLLRGARPRGRHVPRLGARGQGNQASHPVGQGSRDMRLEGQQHWQQHVKRSVSLGDVPFRDTKRVTVEAPATLHVSLYQTVQHEYADTGKS